MLYLAQVQRQDSDGNAMLQLLAAQKAEHTWALVKEDSLELPQEAASFSDGALVLVTVSSSRQVHEVCDAKAWLLDIVEHYLAAGISPALLKEEVQRAEQWRQSLTLQSQELGRRALEMEARRDQIQELEENLKLEKKKLEDYWESRHPEAEGTSPTPKLPENVNSSA